MGGVAFDLAIREILSHRHRNSRVQKSAFVPIFATMLCVP